MDKVRYTAARCLIKIENNGYSNLVLKKELSECTDPRDSAFCTSLVYGTVSRMRTLDAILSAYLKGKVEKLDPKVRAILRSGVFQLLFMDKVPVFAAIDESVKLAYAFKKTSASGLVNAVLRNVSKLKGTDLFAAHALKAPGIRYSVSDYIAKLMFEQYGNEAAGILDSSFVPQPVYASVNPLVRPVPQTVEMLAQAGFESEKTFVKDVYHLSSSPIKDRLFEDGSVSPIGLWSAAAAAALEAQSGDKVIDVCAAPGGKSAYIAEQCMNSAEIYSCDISESRLSLISELAKRTAAKLHVVTADARVYNDKFACADRVLCDVPCSGIGVLSAKPDIRYKTQSEIEPLPALQREILNNSARYVKHGGRLVYSTCTINKNENEAVADEFLACNPEFFPVTPDVFVNSTLTADKYIVNIPKNGGEQGFFVASFERK